MAFRFRRDSDSAATALYIVRSGGDGISKDKANDMNSTERALLLCVSAAFVTRPETAAQNLQLHYDLRHAVDPAATPRNYPALIFKSFKTMDYGSFLVKVEIDLDGNRYNVSKVYTEITQTLKFWKPPIFLHLEYTGGLGLFDGASGGYYLDNAYLIGAARPFPWLGAWGSIYVAYKYTNFPSPSNDPQASVYWGKPFPHRWEYGTTAVFWTQNKNHGDIWTAGLHGKRFVFLVENEIWYKPTAAISVGSRINVSSNVYATNGRLLIYPTVGARYLF